MFSKKVDDVKAQSTAIDYVIHCSPIFLYFAETPHKITAIPYVVGKSLPTSDNILVTPVLRLYAENLVDEYGLVREIEDKLICELDYRNAMQVSQFLSREMQKGYVKTGMQRFAGNITITVEPLFKDKDQLDIGKYDITIDRDKNNGNVVSNYIHAAGPSDIQILADVIKEFAINRHIYYYEWLIHNHINKEAEMLKTDVEA